MPSPHLPATTIPDAAKSLSSPDQPKALLALLSDASTACQDALSKSAAAGAAQPQALLQAYARLQQLRKSGPVAAAPGAGGTSSGAVGGGAMAAGGGAEGGPSAAAAAALVPPGAPAALEITAKVLAAVEGLMFGPEPGDAAGVAKAEQVCFEGWGWVWGNDLDLVGRRGLPRSCSLPGPSPALSLPLLLTLPHPCPLPPSPLQSIRTTMGLLHQMPTTNIELWSRLARAAAGKRCWAPARECAAAAQGALPLGLRGEGLARLEGAGEVPEVTREGWFWLAVAELVHGQVRGAGTGYLARLVLARRRRC